MKAIRKFALFLMCLVLSGSCFFACAEKQKEGKVVITESKFEIRQDSEKAYVVDAKGKVKNVGDVDVKNVVVTGFCRSCIEMIKPGYWFVSGIEKTPDQKDTISFLAAGAEEAFSFKEVAFMYNTVSETPGSMPEGLEAVVASFEVQE